MWRANAGAESSWGEEDSEDVVGHGWDDAVPGLANSNHLPSPWGDYNPAPSRYRGFRVAWMGAKECCWLIAAKVGSI